jgi:hypothetical protein
MHKYLLPHHRAGLEEDSGISPEVIEEMGAWSATTREELKSLGFTQGQITPPAMVLPVKTWSQPDNVPFSRIRPDHPRKNANGRSVKYEQPLGQGSRVYCLPSARNLITAMQSGPAEKGPQLPLVFVTEGEKKAAALVSQGLAALAIPGVWNCRNVEALRGDWDVIGLKGMAVCIVFDSDATTNDAVALAEVRLTKMLLGLGAIVSICRLPSGPNGGKVGVDDYFVQGGTVEGLKDLIQDFEPDESSKPTKRHHADRILELVQEDVHLWHSGQGEPFATIPIPAGGFENLKIDDPRFREWLVRKCWEAEKVTPSREALDRACDNLSAKARFEGEQKEVCLRTAFADGAVWVDLADATRRVTKVTADGWEVVGDVECPVRFARPRQMTALPEPIPGGEMRSLQQLLCVDDDGIVVIEAFLLGAFMPSTGGFPVLVVTGEQGSGKSFGCKVLRSLIDPSQLGLRNSPRDEADLGASLNSGYLLAFDNLSRISGWLSDSLCSLATGGGLARRKLYSDAEEHVVIGRRPVLLNGINDVTNAPDLAERCLFVEFRRPDGDARRTEKDLDALLKELRPGLLGALLDRISRALRDSNLTPPGELPRLADFATWVYAGTPPELRGEVWRVLNTNRKEKILATIEESPLAFAIRVLAERGGFLGSAQELLAELNDQEKIVAIKDRPEGWPASADALGKHLRRLQPVLKGAGVEVHSQRGKRRVWTISMKPADEVAQASEVSASPFDEPDPDEEHDDAWGPSADTSEREAALNAWRL